MKSSDVFTRELSKHICIYNHISVNHQVPPTCMYLTPILLSVPIYLFNMVHILLLTKSNIMPPKQSLKRMV